MYVRLLFSSCCVVTLYTLYTNSAPGISLHLLLALDDYEHKIYFTDKGLLVITVVLPVQPLNTAFDSLWMAV